MLTLLLFLPSITNQFRCTPLKRYLKFGNTSSVDFQARNSLFHPHLVHSTPPNIKFYTHSSKMDPNTTSIASIPPGDSIITISLNYNNSLITLNRSKSEFLRDTLNRLRLSVLKSFEKDKTATSQTRLNPEDISLLDKNSNKIDVDTPIIDALLSAKYFSILNSKIPIVVTQPFIKSLKLNLKPLTGTPILPDFELEPGVESKDLEFEWLNQQADETVTTLQKSENPVLLVNENLTGNLAVKISKKGDEVGYITNYLPVTKFNHIAWQSRRIQNLGIKSPKNIRVVSFNILAPVYLTTYDSISKFFPYCDPEALNLSHRMPLILRELYLLQPDIACLQEVSQRVYSDYLERGLTGYRGWYKVKSGNVYEGCACLYNTDRLELIETLDLNFNSLMRSPYYASMAKKILKGWPEISFDSYHTIFQIGLFREKNYKNNWIIVGNSHFYYHPSAKHIRFIQALVFISQLDNFEKMVIDKYNIPESLIKTFVCGDLNSKPEESVYELFTKGFVDSNHNDIMFKTNEDNSSFSNLPLHFIPPPHSPTITPASGPTVPSDSTYPTDRAEPKILSTTLSPYSSVYKGVGIEGSGIELEFSNIVEIFDGLLDYIFYKNSKPVSVLKGITKSEGRLYVGLPSIYYPSDHISLGADFDIYN